MNEQVITKTCIVCPVGCELSIQLGADGQCQEVTGHRCPRGQAYAIAEITDPRRVLTSTVAVAGSEHRLLPVRTKEAIPKDMLFAAIQELQKVLVKAPVHVGDVVIEDLLGTGIPVIASRDVKSA